MADDIISYKNINAITLNEYPPGIGYLDESDAYTRQKIYMGSFCVVTKDGDVYPASQETPLRFYAPNSGNASVKVELFKGYDDIDYSGALYRRVDPEDMNSVYILILKPGCYTIEAEDSGNVLIKKQCVQSARLDVPYNTGDYVGKPEYVFRKQYSSASTIPLGNAKISFYVKNHCLWDTYYDCDVVKYSESGSVIRLTGRAYLNILDYGRIGLLEGHGAYTFSHDGEGNFTASNGTEGDVFYSYISTSTIRVYPKNENKTFLTDGSVQITRYEFSDINNISYIRRIGGKQLFCYLENGTVIPFQRTGKNLYGYGETQLNGLDYGSYMLVSIDGGEQVKMDYWQKRNIYVPAGGD